VVVRLADGTKRRITGTPSLNTKRAALAAERAHVERVLSPAPASVREVPTVRSFFKSFMDHARLNNKESGVAAKQGDLHLPPPGTRRRSAAGRDPPRDGRAAQGQADQR
jgi:hypothetical protein